MKPYPYTRAYRDRHGRWRVEYRRHGRTIPLNGEMGTAEFQAAYDVAKALLEVGAAPQPSLTLEMAKDGTLRWLCVQWFKSAEFGELGEETRNEHRRRLEEMMREPARPDSEFRFGDYPAAKLEAKHIKVLRDRKQDTPNAANHRLITLRRLFDWAIENDNIGGVIHNPARNVRKLQAHSDGHHPWTEEEREQYKRRWPIGTKERLAYELFFNMGQRRGDVFEFGPQHIRKNENGELVLDFTQEKNRARKPMKMVLLIHPDVQTALDATQIGKTTFITKDKAGNPFSTKKSLGTWFKASCVKAGLPHCSAHGLRKASATFHANNGATSNELMAIHGWRSLSSANPYVRKANQEKLAAQAMARVMKKSA